MGVISENVEFKPINIDGEEINIFLEDPLIVGEVTSYSESLRELEKLIRKIEIVKQKYKREPKKYLIILTVKEDVVDVLRKSCEEMDIELIIGKVVK